MRVISGTYRGKKLFAPLGIATRPTSDRVKEALFNILARRIDFTDIRVLDVCAGSGSLGVEALSRGAGQCCFIESSPLANKILEKNIQSVCCQDRSVIMNMDAIKALHTLAIKSNNFDLVFFDPPYDSGLYKSVLEIISLTDLISLDSIVVAECSIRNRLAGSYGRLKCFDRREYGETALEFYKIEVL